MCGRIVLENLVHLPTTLNQRIDNNMIVRQGGRQHHFQSESFEEVFREMSADDRQHTAVSVFRRSDQQAHEAPAPVVVGTDREKSDMQSAALVENTPEQLRALIE